MRIEGPLAEQVHWAMEQVGLDFVMFKDRQLYSLSNGEQRKVALASTLALRPSILLLDEPTAGLDPYSRKDLLDRLANMAGSGMTIVISSHQMEDLAMMAQTLTVFQSGRSILSGNTSEVFRIRSLYSFGLEPPVAVQLAEALRRKGWPVPAAILTLADLSNELQSFRMRMSK
jgi:energy-coupling factor transport system ATP-binding protein